MFKNLSSMRKEFFAIPVVLILGLAAIAVMNLAHHSQPTNSADSMATAVAQIYTTMTAQAQVNEVVNAMFATQTALAPTITPTPRPTNTPAPTHTPTAAASPGATEVSPPDGMTIVYIPPGQFLMGTSSNSQVVKAEEQPQRSIFMDGYWIDKVPVTNGMYHKCLNAGKCNGLVTSTNYYEIFTNPNFTNHPVVYVNWNDAMKYCAWVGGSLPTEAQWEKAARGTDGRIYPWGNNPPTSKLANYNGYAGMTTIVGSYPDGASPYGLLDMAGNVREWIKDWYSDYYLHDATASDPAGPPKGINHTLKGGGWRDPPIYLRSASRLQHIANSPGEDRGFRCVRPAN
ncbi:MAG: SUMF1/EgtB/PvdO family nonheme iron enzyme [Anaerolineaceae bacterium]|nr:SUMF1/EgtB/PvdO family nonheme iron enzyme [Anaerolineaceae bacterium]